MARMNLTPASELVDEVWGRVGTPERDEMEAQLKEELNAYFIGEAIKRARLAQNPHPRGIRRAYRSTTCSDIKIGKR